MEGLTLAQVLTAAGAVGAAALITGFVALLKNLPQLGPWLDKGNEPLVVFVLSLALVAAAFASVGTVTPESVFGAVLAWYGIAAIAMNTHDQVAKIQAARATLP